MSIAESSENWSFENLTQSTDSGYPLLNHNNNPELAHSTKPQNPPLSLVLGSEIRGKNSHTLLGRSPSSSSTNAYLRRNQPQGQRPDSFASETFSIHTIQQQQQQQQQQLYGQKQHSVSMFATPDSNRIQYRSASSSTSIGSPTSIQQHQPHQPSQQASYSNLTPRSSVYSDRAVFVPGKSLENEVGSGMQQSGAHTASPPLVASAAGNASRANGSATSAHAGHAGDFSNRNRSQSIVALSSPNKHISGSDSRQNWDAQTFYPTRLGSLGGPSNARQQNVTGDNGNVAIPNSGYTSDPSAYKSYDLPRNADSEPRNTREASQWQRIRVERDYSTGIDRQFAVKVPEQMVGKIDEQKFKKFVRRVNALLAEADGATLRNVIEGCLAFATLYISTLVIKPHSRKIIDRISALVQKENESLFRPAGFLVIDPKQTAYMFIEFVRL